MGYWRGWSSGIYLLTHGGLVTVFYGHISGWLIKKNSLRSNSTQQGHPLMYLF